MFRAIGEKVIYSLFRRICLFLWIWWELLFRWAPHGSRQWPSLSWLLLLLQILRYRTTCCPWKNMNPGPLRSPANQPNSQAQGTPYQTSDIQHLNRPPPPFPRPEDQKSKDNLLNSTQNEVESGSFFDIISSLVLILLSNSSFWTFSVFEFSWEFDRDLQWIYNPFLQSN